MQKIFTTQLIGYFQRIQEKEQEHMEDGARLLAQAAIGEGAIYVKGFQELIGIDIQLEKSREPFPSAKRLEDLNEITTVDRVLLFTPFSTDEAAIQLAKDLGKKGVPIVGVSAVIEGEESLEQHVDVHVDSTLKKPIIPTEDGHRIGFPVLMTSLYVYYSLFFIMQEILEEYGES